MADSLSVIPESRREAPLSVHGVVLFPAAPGGSVVHVDAAEYVQWLRSRVVTLRSQVALCRAALPADAQDAVDALNFGVRGSDTVSNPSRPPSRSIKASTSLNNSSAFTAIECRPSVFKPYDDGTKSKLPLLRRIFDRSSSSKNTAIGSDEASEIDSPSSNFESHMPRVASETDADTRRRRRRSISLDNFSRNLILVDSPVSANTTPAPQPTPITLNTLPRARTSTAIHRLAEQQASRVIPIRPIPKRANSINKGINKYINNSISNNNISNDSYSGDNSNSNTDHSDVEVDDAVDVHIAEPMDDDDECYSDGDSINPELATVASHLHLDVDNINTDTMSMSLSGESGCESTDDLDSLPDFNLRSHSLGLAPVNGKHHGHGGERKRRVPTNLAKAQYFPVATSSIDSTDRNHAAAEALARRTSLHKARRSFSMENFKRDSTPNNAAHTGGDNVPISTTNIFLNGSGRRASLADYVPTNINGNNNGSWKGYLFGTRLGKRSTFPRESYTVIKRVSVSTGSGAAQERNGTMPFQSRISIGSRSRSSVRSSWKTENDHAGAPVQKRDASNASAYKDRERDITNGNINIEMNGAAPTPINNGGQARTYKKGIKLGALFRFQSKYS